RFALKVAFDDWVRRHRHWNPVANASVLFDNDVDLRRRIAMNDIDGNAIKWIAIVRIAWLRLVVAPIEVEMSAAASMGDHCRRVGGHGRRGDVLIPRIVGREELLAQ